MLSDCHPLKQKEIYSTYSKLLINNENQNWNNSPSSCIYLNK